MDIKKKAIFERSLLLITAAFSIGVAWRIRGDHGFGGAIGMLVPAILLTLLIFNIWPDNPKATYSFFGLSVILMIATANGWGTINGQITGRFGLMEVSPFAGAFWMFCVGFGWVPLWAFTMGYFFSDKYGLKEKLTLKMFIFGILAYVITRIFSELLLAHAIVPIISPDLYQLFTQGLQDTGSDLSPWTAFVTHYKNDDWFTTIEGGRVYASIISNLSSSIGVLGLFIYARYVLKDKKASNMILVISLIFGLSILIADFWMFWSGGCTTQNPCVAPDWVYGWTLWEYSTGFLAGLFTMLYFLKIQKNPQIEEKSIEKEKMDLFSPKFRNFFNLLFSFGVVCLISLISPLSSRLNKDFPESNIKDIVTGVGLLILLIVFILGMMKKIQVPQWSVKKYSYVGFLAYHIVFIIIYFTTYNHNYWGNYFTYLILISTLFSIVSFILFNISREKSESASLK